MFYRGSNVHITIQTSLSAASPLLALPGDSEQTRDDAPQSTAALPDGQDDTAEAGKERPNLQNATSASTHTGPHRGRSTHHGHDNPRREEARREDVLAAAKRDWNDDRDGDDDDRGQPERALRVRGQQVLIVRVRVRELVVRLGGRCGLARVVRRDLLVNGDVRALFVVVGRSDSGLPAEALYVAQTVVLHDQPDWATKSEWLHGQKKKGSARTRARAAEVIVVGLDEAHDDGDDRARAHTRQAARERRVARGEQRLVD